MNLRNSHRHLSSLCSLAALVLLAGLLPGITRAAAPAVGADRRAPAADQRVHVFLPLIATASSQPATISFWGMNLYLTKFERTGTGDNRSLLADTALQSGAAWTREELVWDLIEPYNDDFRTIYDENLRLAARKGFGVIGMLLTTPAWARDSTCRPTREAYWCPPASAQEYAEFAAWMTERYDGDGVQDAAGSPRVAAWELWNEPNDVGNWADIGADANARKRRYGELLVATYAAIKAADPSATVLLGGMYIFDGYCSNGICDGFNFLNAAGGVFQQTPQARQAFDVFATHPYASPIRPDALNVPRIVLIEGTSRATRSWLDAPDVGRPDAQIWITELGWCTTPGVCPGDLQVTEDQQANYLIRAMVIAQQNGIQHVSWFQFEDAFNNPNRMWGNGAIVRDYNGAAYPPKPAFYAYRTLAGQLRNALPLGIGPIHTHQFDPSQPYTNSGGTYNYRYQRDGTLIDVLWRPNDTVQAAFPVNTSLPVTRIDRDGTQTPLTPAGGMVQLTLSERPILVVQGYVAPWP